MEEKQLNEKESLQLIQQMITMAKKEQQDDGRGWIFWGWMLFAASILTLFNLQYHWFQTFFFWNMFGFATILFFLYELGRRFFFKKKEKVKTYTGDLFARLDTGFTVSLLFILVAINVGGRLIAERFGTSDMIITNIGFALLINLYAFWILIYGTALNFKPSIIGAYCTWAVGLVALFMNDFEKVMLLHALAALIGYVIPGTIANREFKKTRKEAVAGV
jgi:MFS family permease